MHIPVSEGSIFNFNKQAFDAPAGFEDLVKEKLTNAAVVHTDDTCINMGSKRHGLECVSNDFWTLYYPHEKRGTDAFFYDIWALPGFKGILIHDHWKPYYKLDCGHALCNAIT